MQENAALEAARRIAMRQKKIHIRDMKMKWNACLLGVVLCLSATFASAETKISVGILQFQKAGNVPNDAIAVVQQFVSARFTADKRFQVLERVQLAAVQAERAAQGALDVKTKTAIADQGAQYVVVGEVNQVDIVQEALQGGGVNYRATATYGLKILDVSTGQVAYSQQFSSASEALKSMFAGITDNTSTPAGALGVALKKTDKKLGSFLAEAFPVQGFLASIEKSGKNGASEVVVTLGSEDGVAKNTKLNAFAEETITAGGKSLLRKKSVAELTLQKVEGEHIALAKVDSGGDAITEMMAAGRELKVEVRQ